MQQEYVCAFFMLSFQALMSNNPRSHALRFLSCNGCDKAHFVICIFRRCHFVHSIRVLAQWLQVLLVKSNASSLTHLNIMLYLCPTVALRCSLKRQHKGETPYLPVLRCWIETTFISLCMMAVLALTGNTIGFPEDGSNPPSISFPQPLRTDRMLPTSASMSLLSRLVDHLLPVTPFLHKVVRGGNSGTALQIISLVGPDLLSRILIVWVIPVQCGQL